MRGLTAALPHLAAHLFSSEGVLRQSAAWAIGQIGTEEGIACCVNVSWKKLIPMSETRLFMPWPSTIIEAMPDSHKESIVDYTKRIAFQSHSVMEIIVDRNRGFGGCVHRRTINLVEFGIESLWAA